MFWNFGIPNSSNSEVFRNNSCNLGMLQNSNVSKFWNSGLSYPRAFPKFRCSEIQNSCITGIFRDFFVPKFYLFQRIPTFRNFGMFWNHNFLKFQQSLLPKLSTLWNLRKWFCQLQSSNFTSKMFLNSLFYTPSLWNKVLILIHFENI